MLHLINFEKILANSHENIVQIISKTRRSEPTLQGPETGLRASMIQGLFRESRKNLLAREITVGSFGTREITPCSFASREKTNSLAKKLRRLSTVFYTSRERTSCFASFGERTRSHFATHERTRSYFTTREMTPPCVDCSAISTCDLLQEKGR